MDHAILGAGGVGGFVGAVLTHAGADVTLLLRPETLAVHPGTLRLESPLGAISGPVDCAGSLEHPVDVLWVTTKATQLEAALALVPYPSRARLVVPLLNGIDHLALLRERLDGTRVVPGTIAGEMERVAPGHIVHRSPFARLAFGSRGRRGLDFAAHALSRLGCAVTFTEDETTLLWRKLVLLAPFALATTATGRPIGAVREDPTERERLEGAAREACAVALAEGARVDLATLLESFNGFPADMRSSMQKDVAAGRTPELDAIAGPILRGAQRHGIPAPFTAGLAAAIAAR